MSLNPIYTEALPYIDVTPPYFALLDLSPLPSSSSGLPGVSSTFVREQVPAVNNATSFCGSELGRHAAILGSVAAAYTNPVKAKHYYLALEALADFKNFPQTQELRVEAHITSAKWKKRRVVAEIQMFTPNGIFAGKLTVSYAIVPQKKLSSITKAVNSEHVLGTEWQPGESSPYRNPIMLRMIKVHSPDLATAIISLHDRRSMAGHFSTVPTAPVAILSSNGIVLCRQLLENRDGRRWFERKGRIICQRLAVAGEILDLKARKLNGGEYSHQVEFWDEEGKQLGTIDFLFEAVDPEMEGEPKL